MNRPVIRSVSTPLIAILFVATASVAGVGVDYETWDINGPSEQVSVFVTLDGTGDPLAACREFHTSPGSTVDATVTVTLRNGDSVPMAGVPAEDLWLESSEYNLAPCTGGSIADGPSDANGIMTFSSPLRGGGFSDLAAGEQATVTYNGDRISWANIDILFNSPDINGDLVVNLDDVILFSQRYPASAGYHYAVDYYYDGVNDLCDLVLFAGNTNTICD